MHSNYKKANAAPRCQYVRMNDQRCTQPALQDQVFCRFHEYVERPLRDTRFIPFVEDATTLQFALMQVIRGLQLGEITRPVAGAILYALQIASSNLKHFSEEAGHPFAEPAARKSAKERKEEEALEGPSFAELVIERLGLVDPEQQRPSPPSPPTDLRMSRSPDSPCRSASPAVKAEGVKLEPGRIDKLEACIDPLFSRRSIRGLHH